MDKVDQLFKAKALLNQALSAAAASMPNNQHVVETKSHIKRALGSLERASKGVARKQKGQTQFEQWWGNVQSGVSQGAHSQQANSPVSGEAYAKSLAQLNAMIAEETNKLDALEKQSQESQKKTNTAIPDLLED